ncbi:MAG: IBR domain-containing protein, partial [Sulfuritalea sp.]|nr:IBR domain-containing protein [Sulfuritalea sp.]
TIRRLGRNSRVYSPAGRPIHRLLASLSGNEKAALDFVNEFGLLYGGDENTYISFQEFGRSVRALVQRIDAAVQFDKFMKRKHSELSDETSLPPPQSLAASLFNDGPGARLTMQIDPVTMLTRFVPITLADWILISAADELLNGPKWRYCAAAGCGTLMKLGHGGYKANAITCSDKCRQAKSRAYPDA